MRDAPKLLDGVRVKTTMIYTHVLQQSGVRGGRSPIDTPITRGPQSPALHTGRPGSLTSA